MLKPYTRRTFFKQSLVCSFKRWNSKVENSGISSAKISAEGNEETETLSASTPTSTPNASTAPDLPCENDVSTLTDLPWEEPEVKDKLFPETNNRVKESSVNELILAPMKKKSSPIQKLQPRKRNVKSASDINIQIERDFKNLMQFKYNVTPDDFFANIDDLKPSSNIVTIKQLGELAQTLDKSFRVKQLKSYIFERAPEITIRKSDTKKKLINKLISEHWDLKVTLDPTEDLISEITIDISNSRDLFLLLSHKGFLPQHWSLIGAQLSLSKSRHELVVRGSSNIVNFVQASWNDLLNNVSTDTLELYDVKRFYKSINKTLDLDLIQKEFSVYFDKITYDSDSEKYMLSAIKNSLISKVKIEILKATEYRVGSSAVVIDELIERAKKTDKEMLVRMEIWDDSLPWYVRPENCFRYAMSKKRKSESLLSDESMVVKILSEEVQDLKAEVEEAKEKFEYNYIQSGIRDEVKINRDEDYDKNFFKIKEGSVVSEVELDATSIQKELLSIPEVKVEGKLVLDNTISVKLGKLLYSKEDDSASHFNSNIPEFIRRIGKLELMDKGSSLFGSSGGILNRFSKQIHIKLIPNGFWNNKFDKFTKFPSIDILVDYRDNRLEVNNFSAFVSEVERNVDVAIPTLELDLRFQNSINSMLVYNKDQWILNGRSEAEFQDTNGDKEENDVTRNKKQINMFISQIARKNLDSRSTAGLRGMIHQFKYKPYTFIINGEPIKYSAVSVDFVKSIELEHEGLPVSLELKDDGEHQRVEVSMLKEENATMDSFVQSSISLSQFLCK